MAARVDECKTPARLGDAPPCLPFRKPFDLSPWQFLTFLATVIATLGLDAWLSLSDEPFQEGTPLTPMLIARLSVLTFGLCVVFMHPGGRWIPVWMWFILKYFWGNALAVFYDGDPRGARYYDADAEQMAYMQLTGEQAIILVEPPFWAIVKHTWLRDAYWTKHVPYRLLLPVEAQGALELMGDEERRMRWTALWAGLKALSWPVQIVAQARLENADWLVERALPPVGSRFAFLRPAIERWAREQAKSTTGRRITVVCSAPDIPKLVEHVKDVTGALVDAALTVRSMDHAEVHEIFNSTYGERRFYPHNSRSFGIDDTNWVTIAVRMFPNEVVVGWIMYVIGQLPVDVALYSEPDDGMWLQKIMEWFEGMCMWSTADTAHHDALADMRMVEQKIKRNEDAIQRLTLLLTMPDQYVGRIENRLKKAGATFRQTRFEHKAARFATTPVGGLPRVGPTRPYDASSAAAVFPFGASGLRMHGPMLGRARESTEAVCLNINDKSLMAKMICMLGTTGAGKTFLLQELIVRGGYPFTLIDLKPHLNNRKHGDYWPLMKAAGAEDNYVVVTRDTPIRFIKSDAVCYNLAALSEDEQAEALAEIAEWEWEQQLDSLVPRLFGIDEANILARTKAGRNFIERVASQGRNANIIGVFASQEVADFLRDRQTKKAVSMSPVLILLAQNWREVDILAETVGLGAGAKEELSKFQPNPEDAGDTRSALLRIGRRIVSFNIEASPEEHAIYTTDPDEKRARRAQLELVAA